MTREQYDKWILFRTSKFNDEKEFANFIINELQILNPKGKYLSKDEVFYTPLISGYNLDEESLSVNVENGLIVVYVGNKKLNAKTIEECIPTKRAYASESDYHFVLLCKLFGYTIDLTN